jgi:hypothetical protein
MPQAVTRLSKWFRFKNSRPRSVNSALGYVGLLLEWADLPQQGGRYELLLSDPDVALEALKGYHTYLRSRVQGGQLASNTAADRDQIAIACLSEIHSRVYNDHIEPLESRRRAGTKAPDSAAVAQFGSVLQAIFDSAATMVLQGKHAAPGRTLRTRATDETKLVELAEGYGPLRLMELTCMAYTGLVFTRRHADELLHRLQSLVIAWGDP